MFSQLVINAVRGYFDKDATTHFDEVANLYRLARINGEDMVALGNQVLSMLQSGELQHDFKSGDDRPTNWIYRGKYHLAISELFQIDTLPFVHSMLKEGAVRAICAFMGYPINCVSSDDVAAIVLTAHMAKLDITVDIPRIRRRVQDYQCRVEMPGWAKTDEQKQKMKAQIEENIRKCNQILDEYKPFPGSSTIL